MVGRFKRKFARYKLRLGPSKIHHIGVFAAEDIPAGQRVIEYTGKRLTYAEGLDLKPPDDRYVVHLDKKWLLDGRKQGSGAEFINHSCAPNLTVSHTSSHLFLMSRRKIRSGEELTLRYSYPVKIRRVKCRCGSRRCRGTLRYVLR